MINERAGFCMMQVISVVQKLPVPYKNGPFQLIIEDERKKILMNFKSETFLISGKESCGSVPLKNHLRIKWGSTLSGCKELLRFFDLERHFPKF